MLDFGNAYDDEMQRHVDRIKQNSRGQKKKEPTIKEKIVQSFNIKQRQLNKILSSQLFWMIATFILTAVGILVSISQ